MRHEGKQQSLGNYKLESDAALAWDEAAKILRGPNAKTNYASLNDYEKAKKSELAKTGLSNEDAMSSSAIKTKAAEMVRITWSTARTTMSQPEDKEECVGEKEVIVKKKTSDYVGVCWVKDRKKWHAQIRHEGKQQSLGKFSLQVDAALAYDQAVKLLRGPSTETNFATLKDYEKAKKSEMKATSLSNDAAMTSASILTMAAEIVRKNWPVTASKDHFVANRRFLGR